MARMAMPQPWHGRPARGFGPAIDLTSDWIAFLGALATENNPLKHKMLRAFVQRSLLAIPRETAIQTGRQGDIGSESVSLFPV